MIDMNDVVAPVLHSRYLSFKNKRQSDDTNR